MYATLRVLDSGAAAWVEEGERDISIKPLEERVQPSLWSMKLLESEPFC